MILNILLVMAISYAVGAIPTAYLIARANDINIFTVGSGNMGATNISRVLGWRWGLVVWFLDSFKGVFVVLFARNILPESYSTATVISALIAIAGHNWSIFVHYFIGSIRGGKGAATAFGTLLMILPLPIISIFFVISGLVIALTRYMSLGVLLMFTLSSVWIIAAVIQGWLDPVYIAYALITLIVILNRFQENIQRLSNGTERRLGEGV